VLLILDLDLSLAPSERGQLDHAITPRYPAGMHLTEENARIATAAAERIVAAVRSQLPRQSASS
jgi:hypothetical protein